MSFHGPLLSQAPTAAGPRARASRQDATPVRIELVDLEHPTRAELERFVALHFARAYGADIRSYMPRLLGLRPHDGVLSGVLGCRFAHERFFLERYVDAPIEQVLAERLAKPVARAGLVEVGNLAVAAAGGARWLIAALTAYLAGAGRTWAVFTAVPALINAFARLGVALVPLAPAHSERLPAHERAAWGSYYDTHPKVMAASVAQSFDALTAYMHARADRHGLGALWLHAFAAGRGNAGT